MLNDFQAQYLHFVNKRYWFILKPIKDLEYFRHLAIRAILQGCTTIEQFSWNYPKPLHNTHDSRIRWELKIYILYINIIYRMQSDAFKCVRRVPVEIFAFNVICLTRHKTTIFMLGKSNIEQKYFIRITTSADACIV